jgi:hypothetical protein
MAKPKKLSRADVHKQIDAFRGILKRNPDGKQSAEQWKESRRPENGEPWALKSKPAAEVRTAGPLGKRKAMSVNSRKAAAMAGL